VKQQAASAEDKDVQSARVRSPRSLWLLAAGMACLSTAIFAGVVVQWEMSATPPVHVPWLALAAAFVLAEAFALNLRFRAEAETFSLSDIVVVLGLFLIAPWQLVVALTLGVGIVATLDRRRAPLKVAFNLAQFTLSAVITVVVFRALAVEGGPSAVRNWLAALAALAASALVASLAVAIAVAVTEGRPSTADVIRSLVLGLCGSMANTMVALIALILIWQSPVAGLLMIGPIAVLFFAYRAYLSEHSKREGLQFLYQASELTNRADDLEGGLVALLDFARETFHVEITEIAVESDDEGVAYRTAAGPGTTMRRMEAVPQGMVAALLNAMPERATIIDAGSVPDLRSREGCVLGPAMLAPLGGDSGLRGVVLAAKPRDTGAPFEKDELKLFETFANHLGVMLEKNQLSNSLAQLHQVKQELSHQAFHDSLTGLANRALFRDRVEEALANAGGDSGLAVLFIDLDDFKTVNDTMGHAAGDYLLQVVGDRIAACVGDGDTPARLGGDEFAVLLPGVAHDADVRVIADRILVALGDPVEIDGQLVVAPASIGIAMHAQAMDAAELMQNADVAMYTAKRNGKGRFDMFEKTMSLSVAHRHQVKMGLERAIANGELVVHYQPVVDTVTSQIVAAEALVRWQDPVRGLLPPSEFVEIAEESGLIIAIGRFVLEEACRQTKQWSAVAPGLRVFVNLSTRQLADPDLFDVVAAALHTSGLEPSQLVLEVTETTMMQDIDLARETLARLKQLGVGIAIDDFGTGYSSLSYLRQLPIDTLKIAKEFIDAVDHTDEDAAFVGGIVKLGHMIGLQVVAEGVERVEQAARLIDMGCDMAQGYYYSRSSEPTGLDHLLGAIEQASGERSVSSVTQ